MKLFFGIFFIQSLLFGTSLPSSLWRTQQNDQSPASPLKPFYYGWFFDENTAKDLAEITHTYLAATYGSVTEFSRFLDESALHENITSNPVKNYYQKPLDPNTGNYDPLYHITAHYCGESDCSAYTEQVQQFLGKTFRTNMIGFVFTNRTYGIRVKLSEEQESIFNAEKNYYYYNSITSDENTDEMFDSNMNLHRQQKEKAALEVINQMGMVTESVMHKVNNLNLSNYIEFIPQEENYHPIESRAHVTVGVAPGVSAVVTGLDLIQVVELEKDPSSLCNRFFLGYGNLSQLNHPVCDVFVLYPSYRMETNTTFNVYNHPPSNSSTVSSTTQSQYYTLNFLQWFSSSSVIMKSFMKWISF